MSDSFEEQGKAAIIEWLNEDIFQEWDGLNHFWNKDYDRSWELKNIDNFQDRVLYLTLELRDGDAKSEISFKYEDKEVYFEEAEDAWVKSDDFRSDAAFWRKIALDFFRRG